MKENFTAALALALAVLLLAGSMTYTTAMSHPVAQIQAPARVSQSIPAEYVGSWAGTAGDIRLSFTVAENGTGTYQFEQGGYTEAYSFTLAVDSDAFSVDIPAANRLGIKSCTGTYAYADGVLTLDVTTEWLQGPGLHYTVPCERVGP